MAHLPAGGGKHRFSSLDGPICATAANDQYKHGWHSAIVIVIAGRNVFLKQSISDGQNSDTHPAGGVAQ